jgi:hypothetical protein
MKVDAADHRRPTPHRHRPMPSHIVDANYRFIAAYNEVNARIGQR